MKIFIGIVIGLVLAGLGWFLFFQPTEVVAPMPEEVALVTPEETIEPEVMEATPDPAVYGTSVNGTELRTKTFGTGEKEILLVGGIHGGYEWNTITLAQRFGTYFSDNPSAIPEDVTITIVPVANPDGLQKVSTADGMSEITPNELAADTTPGRFNANNVDLNRNFDCKWQPTSTWQDKEVNAGTAAFSEPEAAALRNLIIEKQPAATVFWHSASNGIYASYCEDGVLPNTELYGTIYSDAAGYPWFESFDFYEVTGDAADWMASVGLPAITVELKTHETIEWEQNLAGVQALIAAVSDY